MSLADRLNQLVALGEIENINPFRKDTFFIGFDLKTKKICLLISDQESYKENYEEFNDTDLDTLLESSRSHYENKYDYFDIREAVSNARLAITNLGLNDLMENKNDG